jgi:mono/diheme cytochrome c family protein
MADRTSPRSAILTPIGIALSLLCLAACPLTAATPPARASTAAVKHGEAIFHQRCILCHNKKPGDTTPFGPPNLYQVFGEKPLLTTQQAEQIITHGKGQMPSFNGVLTHADMADVIAYLRSQATKKE